MIDLKNYKKEIIDIAVENNMPWDVGADMFVANIKNAGHEDLPYYAGAEEVDYLALQPEWNAMSLEQQANAKNDFAAFMRRK